jgi:hypothetical protein
MASLSLHLFGGEAGQADDAMNCKKSFRPKRTTGSFHMSLIHNNTTADNEMTMTLMSPY